MPWSVKLRQLECVYSTKYNDYSFVVGTYTVNIGLFFRNTLHRLACGVWDANVSPI